MSVERDAVSQPIEEQPILLRDPVEANLLVAILDEEGIQHFVKVYRNFSRWGVWTFNDAWGHLECAVEDRDRVRAILSGIRDRSAEDPEAQQRLGE